VGSGSLVNVELTNIYPGWSGYVVIILRNDGSVPARVGGEGISVVSGGVLGSYLSVTDTYVFGPFSRDPDTTSLGANSLMLKLPKLTTLPLVLGSGEYAVVVIKLCLSSNAPYGTSGYLTLTIDSGPFTT